MKKRSLLACCVALFLLYGGGLFALGTAPEAHAAQTGDFANHPAKAAIEFALKQGYMWKYPDGKFYPNQRISQAQFVAGLVAIRGEKGAAPVPQLPAGHWARAVYERAQQAGILRDVAIDPNRLLTKEETAKLVFNAWRPYRGEKNKNYTNTGALVTWGWMKPAPPGQPKFREDLPVTRADAAEILRYLWQDKWQLELGKKYADEFHRSLKVENGVITGRVPRGDSNFSIVVRFIPKNKGIIGFVNGQQFKVNLNVVEPFMSLSITNNTNSEDAGVFWYEGFPQLTKKNKTIQFSN